jgi:hypothetical protein
VSGRALWFAIGAGAAMYTSFRVRRVAYRFTPPGVVDQLAAMGAGVRAFSDEVRVGMAEREAEIAEQLGLGARAPRPALAEQVDLGPRALAASTPVCSS